MNNIPNAILLVGCLFVSVIGISKNIDNGLFWLSIVGAYLLSIITWTSLDSTVNSKRKKLSLIKDDLENTKLEAEINKIKKETELLK